MSSFTKSMAAVGLLYLVLYITVYGHAIYERNQYEDALARRGDRLLQLATQCTDRELDDTMTIQQRGSIVEKCWLDADKAIPKVSR